jgi:hypothetical protein
MDEPWGAGAPIPEFNGELAVRRKVKGLAYSPDAWASQEGQGHQVRV